MEPWRLSNVFVALLVGVAVGVRLALGYSEWGSLLSNRVEVSTPVNSIKRLIEGFYMRELGHSPYAGFALHAPPLLCVLLEPFLGNSTTSGASRPVLVCPLLVLSDVVGAWLVYRIAQNFLSCNAGGSSPPTRPATASSVVDPTPSTWADDVARMCGVLYLVNPCIAMACIAGTWSSLENLAILFSIYGATQRNPALAAFGVAAASYLTLFPILLAAPIAQLMRVGLDPLEGSKSVLPLKPKAELAVKLFAICLVVWLAALVGLSEVAMQGHASAPVGWIAKTYGFMLTVEDLSPNLGLYWYFFVELFDYFRPFFLLAFLSQPLIATAPLLIRFPHRPLFCAVMLLLIISIFKPYPSVADLGLCLSLLPMFVAQFEHLRWGFIVINGLLAVTVMAPIFWHLWINTGVANSNFYYAITLVYTATQTTLLTDCIASTAKFDHLRKDNAKAA